MLIVIRKEGVVSNGATVNVSSDWSASSWTYWNYTGFLNDIKRFFFLGGQRRDKVP